MFSMELKRAFSSKGMLIVVLFSILLSVAQLKGSLAMQKEYDGNNNTCGNGEGGRSYYVLSGYGL